MSDLRQQRLKQQHADATTEKTRLDARYYELKNQLRLVGAEIEQKRMELEELEADMEALEQELAEHDHEDE